MNQEYLQAGGTGKQYSKQGGTIFRQPGLGRAGVEAAAAAAAAAVG